MEKIKRDIKSYDELTLRDLQYMYKHKDLSHMEQMKIFIKYFEDIDISNLTLGESDKYIQKYNFIKSVPDIKPTTTFNFKDEEWIIQIDLSKMTFGNFIVYEKVSEDYDLDKAHLVLAAICMKKKEMKWDLSTKQFYERADMFLDLPVTDLYNLSSFFLQRRNMLEEIIRLYTTEKRIIQIKS